MKRWCHECCELKKKHRSIHNDREAYERQVVPPEQNQLLEESLRRLHQKNEHSRSSGSDEQPEDPLDSIKTFEHQVIFEEVKRLATICVENHLKQLAVPELETLDEQIDQWIWVYRVILLPSVVLHDLIFQFGEKQAKANYRKLCIVIHPDKNEHPKASQAFQKLLEVYTKPA